MKAPQDDEAKNLFPEKRDAIIKFCLSMLMLYSENHWIKTELYFYHSIITQQGFY